MIKKKILFSIFLLVFFLSPLLVRAQGLKFNFMPNDQEMLRMKNETQGQTQWSDPVSANASDKISFKVYYHCGTETQILTNEKVQNAVIRLTFPIENQGIIISTAEVLADHAFNAANNGTINISSAQKLTFENTAKWYRDNEATVSDLNVTQTVGSALVNLGEISCDYLGNYASSGYVIFKAGLSGPVAPGVDLKVNNSDGPIYLDYNSQATLSWTTSGATSCLAGNDWTGNRTTTGSEMTSNLVTSRTYTMICDGPNGRAQDTVNIIISLPQTLSVSLVSTPASGSVPLNGVELKATVSGNALGTINYKFDCTSDGVWDYKFDNVSDNPKTVVGACNYANPGAYNALVRVERGTALAAQATVPITVGLVPVAGTDINLVQAVRNLSDNTNFQSQVSANPGEVVEFRVTVTSTGQVPVTGLIIKDNLPDKMNYYGALKVDGVNTVGDILSGLSVGTLAPQQIKTITFQATVSGTKNFGFGTTDLINTALAYNTGLAKTSTSWVGVTKTEVKGATTIPTGPLDSMKFALLLSLVLVLPLTYFLLVKFYLGNQSFVLGMGGVTAALRTKAKSLLPDKTKDRSAERLNKTIEEIRKRES